MSFFAAYYIIYQSYDGEDNMMPTSAEAVIQCFIMSMGGFGGVWSSLEDTDHSVIGKVISRKFKHCLPRVWRFYSIPIIFGPILVQSFDHVLWSFFEVLVMVIVPAQGGWFKSAIRAIDYIFQE